MAKSKKSRRLVFVEAENLADEILLSSGRRPQFLKDDGLEGVLSSGAITAMIERLRKLSVDEYIRQTILPTENPKRKSAPEVIRQLGGTIIQEVSEGPMYLAEMVFTRPERTRRVVVLAQNRKAKNGVWMPRHHNRAAELLRYYSSYGLPVFTFIDTPGADAGEEANRGNQAHSISDLITEMANLQLPSVGVVFGNGYSGGAIPLATTNVLLSVRDGVFNTIHPMGLSEIAYNYNLSWQECAKYIGVSSYELCRAGYLDGIIDYSPLEGEPPRHLTEAMFSALELVESNTTAFLRQPENDYFFDHYRESIGRYLNPSDLLVEENRIADKTPTGMLNVFGSVYRFHRYLKMRLRLSSQSIRRYSRVEPSAMPEGDLQKRVEGERLDRFQRWSEGPMEIRYDEDLLRRYKRFLDTRRARGADRNRITSFFLGSPEENFKQATQELVTDVGLHLYNFWKVSARDNLVRLVDHLQGLKALSTPASAEKANLLAVLNLPATRQQFGREVRNLVLFDLLYDRLVENLPLIAAELKDTNAITQESMEDLLGKVFEQAAEQFSNIFADHATAADNRDFFIWLEVLISRRDVEKLMRQVSEWKRLAFPRLSEPLFGILTYYFTHLLPSLQAAQRGEIRFEGKFNPRNIGIKDFWNRLNRAYSDLLIQNLLDSVKRNRPIPPALIIDHLFTNFSELENDRMSADPVRFPGFRQSTERALDSGIPPVGVLTGLADFEHGSVKTRVGVVVSNAQFQAGAFDMASGEKVCRLLVECATRTLPLVMIISSGGMQTKEGAGSLFSMAVLNDRLTRFVKDFDLPVICFGFRDCTGGAQASFVTHRLVRTFYLSGCVMPFAGQRVVPSHLPAQAVLSNYLTQVDGSMDGLVVNPFDPEIDTGLVEIDPMVPVASETMQQAIARVLKGEYLPPAVVTEADEGPKAMVSFDPVKRMLVHARGATAARLIEGGHHAGVEVVLIQSDADMESYPARMLLASDRLVCLGGNTPQESYLNDMSVIRIAQQEGVTAIHPGIGFLSENPNFALLCRRNGFNFIGPRATSMELMGNKSNALATARRLNVPVVPGSHGVVTDAMRGQTIAADVGYPVLIKATFGGGGKGMRVVHDPEKFVAEFNRTSQEALSAFGNGDVYLEKFVDTMRHVEVQMLRDRFGNTRELGIRDCTVQRDNQKLIEESGSYRLPEKIVKEIFAYTRRIAKEIDYLGAGTVEFIYDRKAKGVYFMEMNTRLQVEHPVTEMVTRIDIVGEQIRIASGGSIQHLVPQPQGYSMEVRINAERMLVDSEGKMHFQPSPGTITRLSLPTDPNVRVIHAVGEGDSVPPYYDSLIVQIIAHGRSRPAVIKTLRQFLGQAVVEGVYTNKALMEAILDDTEFRKGDYDTHFLEGFMTRVDAAALLTRMESHARARGAVSLETIRIADSDELKVLSPRTAVFYAAPTPDDPPFVEIGEVLDIHRTLCLMETMKVFDNLTLADFNNEELHLFPEEVTFTVTRILAETGQTVNEGDLLFIVKPVNGQAAAS